MRYAEFQIYLKPFIVFSLQDIRKINPSFYRARLSEWQEKGYIKKLRRGFYIRADQELNDSALAIIANRLYGPSYVSFELALSQYGLIPESVYGITSATTKKTCSFVAPIGEFIYRKIKPSLFLGYKLELYQGQNYKIADREKALLDYLYLNPHIRNKEDFEGMRWNSEEFLLHADEKKITEYLALFNNKSLTKRANNFLSFMRG